MLRKEPLVLAAGSTWHYLAGTLHVTQINTVTCIVIMNWRTLRLEKVLMHRFRVSSIGYL
jgi:hypothetical protein